MQRSQFLGLVVLLLGACGGEHGTAARAAEHSVVRGTTVDVATREPLADVELRGPGGLRTRSDERGRFALEGLAPGAAGALEGVARDGRTGSLPLGPLPPGVLEVVLHLR